MPFMRSSEPVSLNSVPRLVVFDGAGAGSGGAGGAGSDTCIKREILDTLPLLESHQTVDPP